MRGRGVAIAAAPVLYRRPRGAAAGPDRAEGSGIWRGALACGCVFVGACPAAQVIYVGVGWTAGQALGAGRQAGSRGRASSGRQRPDALW